jgi:hypothetical protein
MGYITSANEILAKDDFTYEEIDVPEWGGTLRLRSLSGAQRTIITARAQKNRATGDGLYEQLIIMSAVDEDGKLIFDEKQHLEMMKSRNSAVTKRIGEKVLEISGFTPDANSDTESAEKN